MYLCIQCICVSNVSSVSSVLNGVFNAQEYLGHYLRNITSPATDRLRGVPNGLIMQDFADLNACFGSRTVMCILCRAMAA